MQGAQDRLAAFQLINQAALRQGDPLALALYSEIVDGAEPLATRADLAHVDFSAAGVERGIANSQVDCIRQNLETGDGSHGKSWRFTKALGSGQSGARSRE